MQVLKTWAVILGTLALGFFALAWNQSRQTLALRDAEIARLKAHPAEPVPASQTAPASSRPALELPGTAPPAGDDSDPNVAVQALIDMTAERDRYKDGLQRCVDEANRLAKDTGRRFELPPLTLPAAAAAPRSGPAPQSRITSLYEQPTVSRVDDMHVQASGTLHNLGDADGSVDAVITLFKDGRPVGTSRERVSVPAQGQAPWAHTFPWNGQEGVWSASVKVVPVP
jgi:hypothetical protein